MFRLDRCTIKRPKKTKINGEIIYGTPETIYSDIPCHLSVKSLSAVNQSDSTGTVLLDYVLFIDTNLGVTINKNDIIEVITGTGEQVYNLKAGESKKYPMTTQTHCEIDKVA